MMPGESRGVIMVVDDNPENLGMLFTYLDRAGFTVLLEQDGATCDIPVIFITALPDTVDKIKGFEVGGVDYITKPFQHEEVMARLATHLTLRRLQQELQEKNAQLEEKNALVDEKNQQLQEAHASKNQFLSILSHDLRSPLTGLAGIITLLSAGLEHYPKPKVKNLLNKAQLVCESLAALLENLLTWAQMQCGTIAWHPQPLELKMAAEFTLSLLQPQADQKHITLENRITAARMVYADFQMVNAILRNLLSNSIKFTEPGGRVTLSSQSDDDLMTISVSDTGIGIEAQHLPKLFRIDAKFTRFGTAQETGSGLGLLLCKEFVERNGGRIWVESQENKGTTFRFTLPVSGP